MGNFLKLAWEFEVSDDRGIIKALELGGVVDAYPRRIPIMTEIENPFIFPTVYLSLLIGAKYY